MQLRIQDSQIDPWCVCVWPLPLPLAWQSIGVMTLVTRSITLTCFRYCEFHKPNHPDMLTCNNQWCTSNDNHYIDALADRHKSSSVLRNTEIVKEKIDCTQWLVTFLFLQLWIVVIKLNATLYCYVNYIWSWHRISISKALLKLRQIWKFLFCKWSSSNASTTYTYVCLGYLFRQVTNIFAYAFLYLYTSQLTDIPGAVWSRQVAEPCPDVAVDAVAAYVGEDNGVRVRIIAGATVAVIALLVIIVIMAVLFLRRWAALYDVISAGRRQR